jgi:RND family efflux transporter MFP subunit
MSFFFTPILAQAVEPALPAGMSDPPSVIAPPAAQGEMPLSRGTGDLRALLTAPQRATLAASIPGRILEMPVRPGMAFAKGDLLVRFDCAPYSAALNGAKAAVRGAQADANAKERLAKLQSIGRAEVDIARAAVAQAQAQAQSAEISVSYCTITAPYDGHVIDFSAHPFETVQQSQPILEIVGDKALEIEIIVPSAWLSWMTEGTPLKVRIDETASELNTTISRIGAQVDPASQSVVVTAIVPNAPAPSTNPTTRLRAGMSGTAFFKGKP